MPIPSVDLAAFVNGNAITAAGFQSRFEAIEDWINGGIVQADLKSSSTWVGTEHIVKSEFYGSPNQRVQLASAHTHYRYNNGQLENRFLVYDDISPDTYIPIPGMAATVRVLPPHAAGVAWLDIATSWWCYGEGGNLAGGPTYEEVDASQMATYKLFIDGVAVDGTERELFPTFYDGTPNEDRRYLRKNHAIVHSVASLSPGIHHVWVAVKPHAATNLALAAYARDWIRTWTGCRSFLCDVLYL